MKKYKLKIKGNDYEVEVMEVEEASAKVKVNGVLYEVEVDREIKATKTPKLVRSAAAPSTEVETSTIKTAQPGAVHGAKKVKSPLPGKILDVFVKVGDTVKIGQHLFCLEAMKMENNINADKEGVVKVITAQKNDTVMEGDVLLELD
ncbi:MAG: biotin/lipoyl-binding protein [Niabella sp.]